MPKKHNSKKEEEENPPLVGGVPRGSKNEDWFKNHPNGKHFLEEIRRSNKKNHWINDTSDAPPLEGTTTEIDLYGDMRAKYPVGIHRLCVDNDDWMAFADICLKRHKHLLIKSDVNKYGMAALEYVRGAMAAFENQKITAVGEVGHQCTLMHIHLALEGCPTGSVTKEKIIGNTTKKQFAEMSWDFPSSSSCSGGSNNGAKETMDTTSVSRLANLTTRDDFVRLCNSSSFESLVSTTLCDFMEGIRFNEDEYEQVADPAQSLTLVADHAGCFEDLSDIVTEPDYSYSIKTGLHFFFAISHFLENYGYFTPSALVESNALTLEPKDTHTVSQLSSEREQGIGSRSVPGYRFTVKLTPTSKFVELGRKLSEDRKELLYKGKVKQQKATEFYAKVMKAFAAKKTLWFVIYPQMDYQGSKQLVLWADDETYTLQERNESHDWGDHCGPEFDFHATLSGRYTFQPSSAEGQKDAKIVLHPPTAVKGDEHKTVGQWPATTKLSQEQLSQDLVITLDYCKHDGECSKVGGLVPALCDSYGDPSPSHVYLWEKKYVQEMNRCNEPDGVKEKAFDDWDSL